MRWRTAVSLTLAGVIAASPACGIGGSPRSGELEVVASFYPLAEAAEAVGGADVTVTNLTPPGAEPHDVELTPRQVDRIHDADVVVYLGGSFQPAVARVVEQRDTEWDVDALEDARRRHLLDGDDPHLWLVPRHFSFVVSEVATSLANLDRDRKDAYFARSQAYASELSLLAQEFDIGLRDCDRRTIVTAHTAFHYLATEFRLEEVAIAGLSPEAEPTADRLAEVADVVRRTGTTTIFTEELVSPKVAETLARETGVRTAVLDPLESLSDERRARGDTYVTVMRENLAALREALGCR